MPNLLRSTPTLLPLVALAACFAETRGGRDQTPGDIMLEALDDIDDDSLAQRAPLHGQDSPNAIHERFIVVLKKDVSDADAADLFGAPGSLASPDITIEHTYKHALHGFSARLTPAGLDALRDDDRVAFIEADQMVAATAVPWGLDRIDQSDLPLDGAFSADDDGAGVHAYVIDTGLRSTHVSFTGRVGNGYSAISGGTADCDGHGTHVAGTIGGTGVGVAPAVTIHPVRVLGCDGMGSMSGVIAGVEWVKSNAQQPAVANMSLGGDPSWALDQAVRNTIAAGVPVVIAAGNDDIDACYGSPNRVTEAITVGATRSNDRRWYGSNWGSCIDVMAPGAAIQSAWASGDTALSTLSGTSMAAPHVTGVLAMLRQRDPTASPAALAQDLIAAAIPDRLQDLKGSPNLLLSSQLAPGDTPPPEDDADGACSDCPKYDGSLAQTGAYHWQPGGTYYEATSAAMHKGVLTGPAGADFDLYLYRWDGAAWQRVAASEGSSSSESIAFDGTAGFYIWQVKSYSGGGEYLLVLDVPS